MAIRGTVVKSNSGSHPFTSLDGDGTFMGNFESQDKAQGPIERQVNRKLRWTKIVLPSGVLTYQGEDF
jgi:hypothetical protein